MILLRSLAFNVWFYGLTTLMLFGTPPLRLLAPHRAVDYARVWARLVLWGLRVLGGIGYEVTGLEHLPRTGPALLASMHQSAFDTIVWEVIAPRFAIVLKQELTKIPLFGAMLITAGMIPVDRAGGANAVRRMLRAADRAVAENRQILIFPEGTRVAPGVRAPLHPGVAALAARTSLPVIPIVTDSGRHWGRRAFRKIPGTIRIAILPPLPSGLKREALMEILAQNFAGAADTLATPVDKSVGDRAARLTMRASLQE
jgi:1-acyl-sn-glycerol-3-phosphate acyltransferase